MRVLIAGLLPYESGKTEFALLAIEEFKRRGFKPGYFKPVAGHDGWYQYDTVINSINRRLLIGHDAYVVSERLGLLDKLHVVSPLDILTLPVDLVKLNFNTHLYEDYMSYVGRRVALARLTHLHGRVDNYKHAYYVCEDVVSRVSDELQGVLNELVNSVRVDRSIFVKTRSSHVEGLLANPRVYELIDSYLVFHERSDPLIIEGYNDVASPTQGSLTSSYAFVVMPGKALLYSGERYRSAVELLSYRGYPWTVRSSSVVEIAGRPSKAFDIPPKMHRDRLSAVFEDIVDYLIKGAGD